MLRALILTSALAWTAQAFSAVVYQGFTYAADSRFSLSLAVDGQPVVLKGSMRYGDKVTAAQGPVSAELKSYRQESSVVSVIVSVDGQDMSSLFLIEDSNDLHVLNRNPILERRASASGTLEKIIGKLKDPKFKGWTTAQTFAWMKDISDKTPGKQLFQYYDKLELEPVTLPKPTPQAMAGHTDGLRTPAMPPNLRPMDPQVLDQPQLPPGQQANDPVQSSPEARQRAWEKSRQAEWERQRRRGQNGRYLPPQPYGYNNGYPPPNDYDYGGNGYPPPPPPPGGYRSQNNPPPGYGRPPQSYGQSQYGQQYPPPPPQQRGFFENLFGNGSPGTSGY